MAYDLRLIEPKFGSKLTGTIMELDHLRKRELRGSTAPWYFFQLKQVFHWMESLGSARIEGNHTTVAEYIEHKIEGDKNADENIQEIDNVTEAMEYVEENVESGSDITHRLIHEIHSIVVRGLTREGDMTPGAYRNKNVAILNSKHEPPDLLHVQDFMEELLIFVNAENISQFDLIKVALFHHRFTWIHPFNNGNGRVVRMLTYVLLIKYGFNVVDGRILNPSTVFFNDRELYYKCLAFADKGTDDALLSWCYYMLNGILVEINKIDKLLDYEYLSKKILIPALNHALDRKLIHNEEANILKLGVADADVQCFMASDIKGKYTSRQKTHLIKKLKDVGYIKPVQENTRKYCVRFIGSPLMRGVIKSLEDNKFIPCIDKKE